MALSKISPRLSDLRDLGLAFQVPVSGMDQMGISRAIYTRVGTLINTAIGTSIVTVSGGYEYNVKAFGAVGNAVTDDTAAIQAAFTTAVAAVTGTLDYRPVVRIPPGTYRITSTLDFRSDDYAIVLLAEGATLQWDPSDLTTPNQRAIQFGTKTYNKITHRGRVDGLWIENKKLMPPAGGGSSYTYSTGSYTHYADWSASGHTGIYTHNCNNWEFNYVGCRDFLKGIVVASSGYAGHAYNQFEISRLVNNKYSFINEIAGGGWTNQLKVVGGNWTWNAESLYTNSVKLGTAVTCSARLTKVSGYVYGDICVYDATDHRLPWASVSAAASDFYPLVVVVGRGDDAVVLERDTGSGGDYTLDIGNKQLTLTSVTAQAAADRDVNILGLGDDNVVVYVRLKAKDATFTEYEDATGTINWSNDATNLLLWKGVDADKTLLRYGKPGVAHGITTDYSITGSTLGLATANIDPDTLEELSPLILMERPRHVTMFGYRGDSTPSLWTFDACSFEGVAEYGDALYSEGGNTLLTIGCRFECEHTVKLGYFLGRGTSDCHILHGAQGDLDDYHGNTEYRDMAINGKSSRLVRDTWQAKYPTIFGKFGVRTANVQNQVMAIPAIATQTGVGSLLYVGSPASWNPDAGVYSSSGTGAAFSAATYNGPLYYGTLTHDTAENYAPLLLRLIASTSVPPTGTGRLGGGIEIDGPTTVIQATGTDLVVDGTTANLVTSASAPFTIYQVGYTLEVLGGAGWTTGSYPITGFSGSSAKLSGTPAALGATGGIFEVRSILTSAIFRIYTRWMTSGYAGRTSLTQFYTADSVNAFQAPLQFTSANGLTQTLLNDYVGIRRWSALASALYVPWVTGDATTTAYFGSTNPGCARSAITAWSYGNVALSANTYSRYALSATVYDTASGAGLIRTPLVLAHEGELDPTVSYGTGIEFRAHSKPDLYGSGAVPSGWLEVDATDPQKVITGTHTFSASDHNHLLTVSDGVGWTLGGYIVTGSAGGAALLNGSPAAVGTSGGTWSLATASSFTQNLQGQIDLRWLTPDISTRTSRMTLSVSDYVGAKDLIQMDALGSSARLNLYYPTGLRALGDPYRALAIYAPWVAGDAASGSIILAGGINAANDVTAIQGQTSTKVGTHGYAATTGIGALGESVQGYGMVARLKSGIHNAISTALLLSHTCTGTAATGIGVKLDFSAATNGATERTLGDITGYWADVTDATRRGRVSILANNTIAAVTTAYEGIRVEALAAGAPALGFYGAAATAKPTITGNVTSSGLSNLLASLATLGLLTNSSTTKGTVQPGAVKTSSYPITVADSLICASGTITITLPTASTCDGSVFTIKNISADTVTIATGETIDGAGSYSLATQWYSVTVQSCNGVYYIIGKVT